jgi:hypothetical protein
LWKHVRPEKGELSVTLTDRHPNLAAANRVNATGAIRYHEHAVDARAVAPSLRGLRTLFSSFHHFAPADARALLGDAVERRAPIAIFEATRRDAVAIGLTLLAPLIALLATPMIRPFRWSRLFWTYLIPAIPLAVLFDGVVSCLRTYTPNELLALADGLDDYDWEAGTEGGKGLVAVTYLVGVPRESRA